VLALAFHDQPLDRAVVGGSPRRRLRAERAGMRATLEAARGPADVRVSRAADGVTGVLVALPPWTHPLPAPGPAAQLRTLWAQGPRAASRWREVFERLQRHHPPEPVAYLSLLGVAPGRQGRGVGTALLRAWLADVDAAGQSAWLETARPENLPLYRRAGFEVSDEIEILGVPVWLMGRAAARSNPRDPTV
jgi:ribosomal protein S18 acetylase RimI-like enzyme